MLVRMNRSVAVAGAAYTRGQERDIPDNIAASWAASGLVTVLDADALAEAEEIERIEREAAAAEEIQAAEAEGVETEPEPAEVEAEPAEDQDDVDELEDLTLAELREQAKAQDLSTSGKKAELIERLRGE